MSFRNHLTRSALVGAITITVAVTTGVADAAPPPIVNGSGWTVTVVNDVPGLPGLAGQAGVFSNVRTMTSYIPSGASGSVVGAADRNNNPVDIDFRYRDGRLSDFDGGVNVRIRQTPQGQAILTCTPDLNTTLECTAAATSTTRAFRVRIW